MMQTTPAITAAPIPGTYWQWRGHSVYYVRSSNRAPKEGSLHPDRPPLLLIHGFGASTDHWRKNISGLSKDFEVWAIDLIGFGRSAKPEIQYSGDLWHDQIHDFITNVIGRPAVLAGNSLGGYAALCSAAQRPESAAGLILINSAGPFSEPQPAPEAPPLQKAISTVAKALFQQDWASFLLFQYVRQRSTIRKTLEKVYLDQSAVTDQLVEEIYQPSCSRGAVKVFASVFRTPQGEKIDLLLSQLSCGLLMLWGSGDPWMNSTERSAKFRKHYPQLTEHFLKAGHCPHDEVPEQINELIRDWIIRHLQ